MKKTFTFCLTLILFLSVKAQSDFPIQFTDVNGNVIADGSILQLTEFITDDFGEIQIPSRLYVKNLTNEAIQVGGNYTISNIDGGVFQTCFPENCARQNSVGSYTTSNGRLEANELKNMQTEWIPSGEGAARITYQLLTYVQNPRNMKWIIDGVGPKITMDFTYKTSSINGVSEKKDVHSINYYDLQGNRVTTPHKGIYIKSVTYQDKRVENQQVVIK